MSLKEVMADKHNKQCYTGWYNTALSDALLQKLLKLNNRIVDLMSSIQKAMSAQNSPN